MVIHAGSINRDHVHMLLSIPTSLSVSRAVQYLILGGKARALLEGRFHVQVEDIQHLAKSVLRHRVVVNFAAESDGVSSDDVIQRIIDATPTTEDELTRDARFQKIFAT
jgi:MoxR-like ATPase